MKKLNLMLFIALIAMACSKTTTPTTPTVSQPTNTVNLSDNYFDWTGCMGSGRVNMTSQNAYGGVYLAAIYKHVDGSISDSCIKINYSNALYSEMLSFNVKPYAIGTDTFVGALTMPLKYICHPISGENEIVYFAKTWNTNIYIPGNTIAITKNGKVGELVQGTFKLKLTCTPQYQSIIDTIYVTGHFSVLKIK